jgi:hypothetical protein
MKPVTSVKFNYVSKTLYASYMFIGLGGKFERTAKKEGLWVEQVRVRSNLLQH